MALSTPNIKPMANGFVFDWDEGDEKHIAVQLSRIEERPNHRSFDAEIEIAIDGTYSKDGEPKAIVSGIRINLLSASQREGLKKALEKNAYTEELRFLPWAELVEQVCSYTIKKVRNESDPVVSLTSDYGKVKPEFLLPPLFVKDAPNIIYADRSSAKSLFMILVDIILTLPWHDNLLGLSIAPDARHTVIYCDWEYTAQVTGWQKECLLRGTGLENCDLPYLRCSRPLADNIDYMLRKIDEVKADVIIIDSLGMAVGDDLNLTPPAFSFFKALRQLPVTPIIVAHTAKDFTNKRKTVYGNAFYENEARSIWEASKYQVPHSNELTLSLFQRKPPAFSGLHDPLAFRFIFDGDTIKIETAEPVSDKRSAEDNAISATDVVYEALDHRDYTKPAELISSTGLSNDAVYQALKRLKDKKLIAGDRTLGYIKPSF